MLTTFRNSLLGLLGFISLVGLTGAPQASGQALVSCQGMAPVQESRDYAYFFTGAHLDETRLMVKNSFDVVKQFQSSRSEEFAEVSQKMSDQSEESKAKLNEVAAKNRFLRITMSLMSSGKIVPDQFSFSLENLINREMDMRHFRALPEKNIEPLSKSEFDEAVSILRAFLSLELSVFEQVLASQVKAENRSKFDPKAQLVRELQQAKSLEHKLIIQHKTLQVYMTQQLAAFRSQERDVATHNMLVDPLVAYTVRNSEVTIATYRAALIKVVENGDYEVDRLNQSLTAWLDVDQFSLLKSQVESRQPDHKKVTVANALLKLKPLFEYIPAVEQGVLKSPEVCGAAERALAIHFSSLSSDQIRSMVLMAGAVSVMPFISGAAVTGAIVGGAVFSIYYLNKTYKDYRELVRDSLTELSYESIDSELMDKISELETSIQVQQLLLPTLPLGLGVGPRFLWLLAKLKKLPGISIAK